LRRKLDAAGLGARVSVDSAGTHAWHAGAPPDLRSQAHARSRGYDLSALRARAVEAADFERFDLILAMDWDNLGLLEEQCPPGRRSRLRRLTEFGRRFDSPVVPDPYSGGGNDFEHVLDLVEDACDGLVQTLLSASKDPTDGTS
jgi:protein-tyrosine phosphatase